MKKSTAFRASKLIAVMAVVLALLLSITSCSFIDSVVSKALGNYSISFEGVDIPIEDVSVKAGEVPIIPTVPEKEGYSGAWTLDGKNFDATATYEYGKDITLSASYTPITYKVIFKADGVQVGEALTYNVENTTVTAPAVPEKAGYNGVWENYSLTMGDVTVNAIYTAKGDTKYTVEHYIENEVGEWELYSSENLTGRTGTTATADAITIENYVAMENVAFGQIAGDGSLVIKLYYQIIRFNVTFDYNSNAEDTVVSVKYGETVSQDAAKLDPTIPYAFLGWMKDGELYDFNAPVTENITLIAGYENEYVFEDAEGELKWIPNKSTTTVSAITGSGVISGSQSMGINIDNTYRGIYKMNLDSINFTNVNYIFMKVKGDASARFIVRFINTNDPYGSHIQYATDVVTDGTWHTICIDMNLLFNGADFSKEDIKTIFMLCDKPTNLVVDDIVFVNDKSLYKQDKIAHYDFEAQSAWSVTGNGNTATIITDGAIRGQSIHVNLSAWNGLVNPKVGGLFTDTNYVYIKIKGVNTNPYLRLYQSIGISNDYYTVQGETVETKGDYRIVRFDISDWNALAVKGAANFGKDAVRTMFIGSLSTASSFTVDDIILASTEIDFTYEVIFKADGVQVGKAQLYTDDNMEIIVPDVPEKAGYTGAWEPYTLGNGDVIVNAIYTPISYTVTFVADGVTVGTANYTVEDKDIVAPIVPAKKGYTGAWEEYTLTIGDVTVNAVYTETFEFKATFIADGQIVSEIIFTKDNKVIEEPQVPAKAGYTGAWESYVLDNSDVTIYAVYTANTDTQYKVEHYIELSDGSFDIYKEEILAGITDTEITVKALTFEEKYVAREASASGIIAGDGSLVIKIYYDIARFDVTFDYGTSQEDTVVTVKYGETVSQDSAALNPKYPFALLGWQKDGAAYDFATEVTENITLTAVYANEYVFEDFEAQGGWTNSGSTTSHTYITNGAISGNQSIQFTAGAYGAIYRTGMNTNIDFTDVNYIFVKVRVAANARLTFRFVNADGATGTNVQNGYDIKADGSWHTICIDLNSIFANATFGKDGIKSLVIMTGAATTVTVDDIVFVKDKDLYKQDIIAHYDFENQGGWTATGAGNTATYVTDGINGQSLQGTLTAWNGLVNQNAAGVFTDANYIYLKIKGTSANPAIRIYKSIGISNDYYSVNGTTLITRADYRIVRYDISDFSKLTIKGAANFTKGEVNTFFIGSLASAATFVIDDVIISATEIEFPYEIIFKADGVQVGETQSYTKDNMEITVPEVPAKAGYTGAWEEYTLGNGDVTVNAIYTPITYTITFVADGVTIGTATYTVDNKSFTAPEVPAKEKHFGEWESIELTIGDVTINAVYTLITESQYKVEHYIEKLDGAYELHSSETFVGEIGSEVSANAITIEHYLAKEASASGTIGGDGSLVLKLYYDLELVDVTFDYAGSQASTTVQVKYGATASASSAAPEGKYPYAIIGWQKDGVAYDFATPITENTTLTAVYANEAVYDDFETEGTWNKSNATTVTYTHITNGAISGNQSLQFTAGAYGAINRQNLDTKIDFTDVNYIFVKVRVAANARVTFRFINANAFSGTQIQAGFDLKADGGWHTICIDMNSIFTESAAFGKDAIKSLVIMTGAATTVTVDDIVFVNDKDLYEQNVIRHFDFENQNGWTASGSTGKLDYVTGDTAINNQSLQVNVAAWNGVYNQNLAGMFADANYIYLKIKGVNANQPIRLSNKTGISTSYYTVQGVTVATVGDYRIVKYDISDWSKLTPKETTSFAKSETVNLFIGGGASALNIVIDDVIISSSELSFN